MSAVAKADPARLLALVGGNWTTQAIGAAVQLGVVDRLAERPRRAAGLAKLVKCDPDALARLLRSLASIDIVAEDEGLYALTPTGSLLREDAPGSVRWWALWCSGPQWTLWADLAESVRTGRSFRERHGGRPGYAHLERDAEAARVFNLAMAGLTQRVGREVARVVNWRGVKRVVDVGGGHGELLVELLKAKPALEGAVFDLPHAAKGATARLKAEKLAGRGRFVAGSFFEALPEGADAYLLKSILHNWDDAKALAILRQVRAAVAPGSRVVLVERVLPERPRGGRRDAAILRSDLNMLVSLGGRERTRKEFASMLAKAGFGTPTVKATATDYSVIEAKPASPRGGRGKAA
jgi:SAM-dependent methyltransferase